MPVDAGERTDVRVTVVSTLHPIAERCRFAQPLAVGLTRRHREGAEASGEQCLRARQPTGLEGSQTDRRREGSTGLTPSPDAGWARRDGRTGEDLRGAGGLERGRRRWSSRTPTSASHPR